MWLPVFMLLLGLFVDVVTIFYSQGRIMTLISETNRALSVGRLADAETAESFLKTEVQAISVNSSVSVTVAAGRISTNVRAPLTDLDVIGLVSVFRGASMTLHAEQLMEY